MTELTWRNTGWQIPTTTGEGFAEFTISATLGVVSGVFSGSVRSAVGIGTTLTSMGKPEIPEMTEYFIKARQEALVRAIAAVQQIGGNAFVGVRFESNAHGDSGTMDVHCWGTAVIVG